MEKTEKNKIRDARKNRNKVWIDEHTEFKDRTCGSGLVFFGRYIKKKDRVVRT